MKEFYCERCHGMYEEMPSEGMCILPDCGGLVKSRAEPCGCVLCICGDEERCHGCGAKACEHHRFGRQSQTSKSVEERQVDALESIAGSLTQMGVIARAIDQQGLDIRSMPDH